MSGIQDRIRWFTQVPALRGPVVETISALEHYPGHWRVLTVGLTYLLFCRAIKMDPFEMLGTLVKMERDADAPFAKQFIAMKEYAANELEVD